MVLEINGATASQEATIRSILEGDQLIWDRRRLETLVRVHMANEVDLPGDGVDNSAYVAYNASTDTADMYLERRLEADQVFFRRVIAHELGHVAIAHLTEADRQWFSEEAFGKPFSEWQTGSWEQRPEEATAEAFVDAFLVNAVASRNASRLRVSEGLWSEAVARFQSFGPTDVYGPAVSLPVVFEFRNSWKADDILPLQADADPNLLTLAGVTTGLEYANQAIPLGLREPNLSSSYYKYSDTYYSTNHDVWRPDVGHSQTGDYGPLGWGSYDGAPSTAILYDGSDPAPYFTDLNALNAYSEYRLMSIDITLPEKRGRLGADLTIHRTSSEQVDWASRSMLSGWRLVDNGYIEDQTGIAPPPAGSPPPEDYCCWEALTEGPWTSEPVVPFTPGRGTWTGEQWRFNGTIKYVKGDAFFELQIPDYTATRYVVTPESIPPEAVWGLDVQHARVALRNIPLQAWSGQRLVWQSRYIAPLPGTPPDPDVMYGSVTWEPLMDLDQASPPYPIYDVAGRIQAAPGPGGVLPR